MPGETHPALETPYSHPFECKSCFWKEDVSVDLSGLPKSFQKTLMEANLLHKKTSPKCHVVFSGDWEHLTLRLMGFCEAHNPAYNFDLPIYPLVRLSIIDAYNSIVRHHAALCTEPLDFVIR